MSGLSSIGTGCTPAAKTEIGRGMLPDDAEIRLSRSAEGSYNPTVYDLVLRGDGLVEWNGRRGVITAGPAEGRVDRDRVTDLWFRFVQEPALAAGYRRNPEAARCMDHYPVFGLELRLASAEEAVAGIREAAACGSPEEASLSELADELDVLAGSQTWIGSREEIERAYIEAVGLVPRAKTHP